MTDKQTTQKPNWIVPFSSFVSGMLCLLIFQAAFVNDDKVVKVNDSILLSIDEKLERLEEKYNDQQSHSLTAQLIQPSSVSKVDINEDALEQLSSTLTRKIADEQDAKIESEQLQQEQTQRAVDNDSAYQDDLLKNSVLAAIQDDAPQRMMNIKEVMVSDEMNSMTPEGRESVVKELVRMANAGEIDMNTFFAN